MNAVMETQPWINRAIESAGSQRKFAASIGVSESFVSHVLAGRAGFPVRKALLVESLYGIPRSEIAPDIYPVEQHNSGAG